VVNIEFVKPPTAAAAPVSGRQPVFGILPNYRLAAGSSGRLAPPPPPPPPPPAAGKLSHIEVTGLSDSARAELLSQLPIQEGGEWTAETFAAVKAAANQFDSHNTVALVQSAGGLTLHISVANGGVAQTAGADLPPGVFRVGNGTLPPSVVSKVDPVFPADAPAGYEGSVLLSIVVGTDGKAENIQIVKSLGANFDANAIYAVEQWVFKPGTNQGVPVKVKAQIEVNYRKV
jgi:TonB family protein